MAATVRLMKRPEREASYLRASLRGMKLTFTHLLKSAGDRSEVTYQYPEEKPPLSPRWRGTHVMEQHEDGRPKCVACGLCPTVCPANCIKLIPGEDDEGNRYPIVYEIDEFRCIFCGMCQEVCPVEAIHVGQDYENGEYTRERFVYDLDRLMAQEHPSTALWDPSDPAGSRVLATQLLFVLFAAAAIFCALMMVTRANPVSCAVWLIGTFFSLAAIYTLLGAFFIGVIQILVYAGAIMVLFLFVIMLLNLGNDYESDMRSDVWKVVGAGAGLVMLALLARLFFGSAEMPLGDAAGPAALMTQTAERGSVGVVGIPMYTDFVVHLQVTGILLLVAVVGAVMLAKRSV